LGLQVRSNSHYRSAIRGALVLLIGLCVGLGTRDARSEPEDDESIEQVEMSSELSPEEDFDPFDSLLEQVLEVHSPERFAECGKTGDVLLNEICAVGLECDPDVRVRDFIELYNAGREPVDLACFALTARDDVVFAPRGILEPGGFRAFGERETGFRIAKSYDVITLYRLGVDDEDNPILTESERVAVGATRAHAYRLPDGGRWRGYAIDEAEEGWQASFGTSNQPSETESEANGEL
jgi:hypothetical protein